MTTPPTPAHTAHEQAITTIAYRLCADAIASRAHSAPTITEALSLLGVSEAHHPGITTKVAQTMTEIASAAPTTEEDTLAAIHILTQESSS